MAEVMLRAGIELGLHPDLSLKFRHSGIARQYPEPMPYGLAHQIRPDKNLVFPML
jgi:hypothetical protein